MRGSVRRTTGANRLVGHAVNLYQLPALARRDSVVEYIAVAAQN
jgi:hypothetical protein